MPDEVSALEMPCSKPFGPVSTTATAIVDAVASTTPARARVKPRTREPRTTARSPRSQTRPAVSSAKDDSSVTPPSRAAWAMNDMPS